MRIADTFLLVSLITVAGATEVGIPETFVPPPLSPEECTVWPLHIPIVTPLLRGFYRKAPTWMGMWEGMSDAEICGILVHGGANWVKPEACACMIMRKEQAFVVTALAGFTGLVVLALCCQCWQRGARPIIHLTVPRLSPAKEKLKPM